MTGPPFSESTQSSLNDFLPGVALRFPAVISLVGAGGKTTTLFRLSQYFKQRGHSVLLTTTTKMYLPERHCYDRLLIEPDQNKLINSLCSIPPSNQITYCCHSYELTTNKVMGLSPSLIETIKECANFSIILIEADGAKQKSLKAPGTEEPCLPECTQWVLALTGAEWINSPAIPDQIHRWSVFSQLLNIEPRQLLHHRIFSQFINHPQGMFKSTPVNAQRTWVINKVTTASPALLLFCQQIITHCPALNSIWLSAMQEELPIKQYVINSKMTCQSTGLEKYL